MKAADASTWASQQACQACASEFDQQSCFWKTEYASKEPKERDEEDTVCFNGCMLEQNDSERSPPTASSSANHGSHNCKPLFQLDAVGRRRAGARRRDLGVT